METVETKALQTFQNPSFMWKRYVDDAFVVIKKNNFETFYEHLNNIEASIKFTLETESNNSLLFLDVLVVKKYGNLTTKLYQKPTHTNRFLNFNSQHLLGQKREIISTLSHRINSKLITKKTDKPIEINKHYVVPTRSGMTISKKQAFLVMKENNWLCFHTWQVSQKKLQEFLKLLT